MPSPNCITEPSSIYWRQPLQRGSSFSSYIKVESSSKVFMESGETSAAPDGGFLAEEEERVLGVCGSKWLGHSLGSETYSRSGTRSTRNQNFRFDFGVDRPR